MAKQDFNNIHKLILENERLTQELKESQQWDWGSIWLYIGLMWTVYGLIMQVISAL